MKKSRLFNAACACTLFVLSMDVFSAPVIVTDGSLQATGFTGITVGNNVYDVIFIGDSFVNHFVDASGLDFSTKEAADAASTALADAFNLYPGLDSYDINPEKTFGCTNVTACIIVTPYLVDDTNPIGIFTSGAENSAFDANDGLDSPHQFTPAQILSGDNRVYADWTYVGTVPIPATVWLFSSGLLGLIGIAKRRKA